MGGVIEPFSKVKNHGEKRDVVVLGAGIAGVCSAAYLLRDGHRVTLIDPSGPGEGTSKGNAGAISPGSCIPLAQPSVFRKIPGWLLDKQGPLVIQPRYFPKVLPWLVRFLAAARPGRVEDVTTALLALHRPCFECYAPLVQNASAEGLLRRTGCMVVFMEKSAFESSKNDSAMRQGRGVDIRELSSSEIQELAPGLSKDYKYGIIQPEHGFIENPYQLVCKLAEQFVRDGGILRKGRAKTIRQSADHCAEIILVDETIIADRVVLAAGIWSKAIAKSMGISVPLESQRGYHIHIDAPNIQLGLPISVSEGKFYATPMQGGLRVAGTVEFAGLEAPPNEKRIDQLVSQAKLLLPGLKVEDYSTWMGHRPCFPDSLPVIGPAPNNPNVLFAFGHGHNGMTGGPVTGRIIADLVAGRPTPIDIKPYRPDRF